MKHLNSILDLGRHTHTCKVWYYILNAFLSHEHVDMQTYEAEQILESHYADKGSSCLKCNEITAQSNYDLQIIIPAYNAEAYIEECIMSILRQQTQYAYHVIIVDDGSTDETAKILQRYNNNQHITLIHQDNKGVSAARNIALRHIDARYVMFVDADDTIPADTIESLLSKAYKCNSDVVEGCIETGSGSIIVSHIDSNDEKYISGYACAKLFKAQLFAKVGFPENYRYEDTLMSFVLFPMAARKSTIKEIVYTYRQNPESFTSGEMQNYAILDAYWVVRQLLKDINSLKISFDNSLYDSFLLGMKLSGQRMNSLDRNTSMAYFSAMCNIANTDFKTCSVKGKLSLIDKAIRNHDYTKYMLASYFI